MSQIEADVSTANVVVDKETGEYSFDICIDSQDGYAGAEFGVICSDGTEVSSIASKAGSITGPKEANGLVWFGFFDGEDSINGEATITVEGTLDTESDAAIVIQDAKVYTIGDQEYASTPLECGMMIELYKAPVSIMEAVEKSGISATMLIGCCAVIAVAAAGALIYKKRMQKRSLMQQRM